MEGQLVIGAGIVLAAGVLQGLFAVPMKFARDWNYENIWLIFALTGLVLFPWILTFSTVPNVGAIYAHTSIDTLAAVVGFGILWGAGATLTGLGLNMLGIGLGLAIILGLSASVGSLGAFAGPDAREAWDAAGPFLPDWYGGNAGGNRSRGARRGTTR